MSSWSGFAAPSPPVLAGPGFSVELPPGFGATPPHPISGSCFAWPPGSWGPVNSPALVWLLPLPAMQVAVLEQHYRNFDHPSVALQNAQSLGLASVMQVAPLRETALNGAPTLLREFDALSLNGQPVRISAMLLRGAASALQCIVGIHLYRWVEFAGPTLQFVSGLQLAGAFSSAGEVRTVIDRQDLSRVEMQVVNADHTVAPIMSMPTAVGTTQIFHIHVDSVGDLRFGDVQGTNVQIGAHNTLDPLGTSASQATSRPTAGEREPMANFQIGNVSGGNNQMGDTNTQTIGVQTIGAGTLTPADRQQVLDLLQQLRTQVQAAPIPEATKKEVAEQVVPAMQQAAQSPDPKTGLTRGLEHLNSNLQQVDTAGKSLGEIVGTAAKIAGVIGTGFHVVAPFLSGLL